MHVDVAIVTATRVQPCQHCGHDVQPGESVAYVAAKPRGVSHLECHAGRRRGVLS